jgi:hypothetical protein
VQLKAFAMGPSGEPVRSQLRIRWTSSDSLKVRVTADGWVYGIAKTKPSDVVFVNAEASKRSGVSMVTVK